MADDGKGDDEKRRFQAESPAREPRTYTFPSSSCERREDQNTNNPRSLICLWEIGDMSGHEAQSKELPMSAPKVSRQEMAEARVPLAYRDSCAHLLIPLNRCRFENYYLTWRCQDERHSYEKCQYEEFKIRVAKMDELRAAKGGVRSN